VSDAIALTAAFLLTPAISFYLSVLLRRYDFSMIRRQRQTMLFAEEIKRTVSRPDWGMARARRQLFPKSS
jgi:hypothetical protein